jgi:hypothetical protein
MPVRLPRKEKKPTTIELRRRWRFFIRQVDREKREGDKGKEEGQMANGKWQISNGADDDLPFEICFLFPSAPSCLHLFRSEGRGRNK